MKKKRRIPLAITILVPVLLGVAAVQGAAFGASVSLSRDADYNDAIGVDLQTDTYDQGQHLNVDGAEKLSRWFGAVLRDAYGLADHRGEAVYDADYARLTERYEQEKQRLRSEEH